VRGAGPLSGEREKEKGRRPWAGLLGRERREEREEGRWPAGLGPKERREREKREKAEQMLLNLIMKFEFKWKTTKITVQRA
jgi:hypothetical protein